MSNPKPADGQPIPEGLIAAVDETVVELQGAVTYVLVAVVFCEHQAALQDIQALTAGRKRPLHWHKEGSTIRKEAVELIEKHVITSVVLARRAGRRSQIKARAEILAELAVKLAAEGVTHVVIESREQHEDGRDMADRQTWAYKGIESSPASSMRTDATAQ